jgi:hypothetical protein
LESKKHCYSGCKQSECCELQKRLAEAEQQITAATNAHTSEIAKQQSDFERQARASKEEHEKAIAELRERFERCVPLYDNQELEFVRFFFPFLM